MHFQFTRHITSEHKIQRKKSFIIGESDDDEDDSDDSDEGASSKSAVDVETRRKAMKGFGRETIHNVISKKDNLTLEPQAKKWPSKVLAGHKISVDSFRREFELGDVLDYVKTGIGSVIEDEVTQRFVAEELKSWNLLTRTSQSFEFVNLRLTVIWIIGFVVRYFVLLPGRTIILCVGVS